MQICLLLSCLILLSQSTLFEFPQLMAGGLHGDSMVLVVKPAVEEYNTNVENARTLLPKKAVKTA